MICAQWNAMQPLRTDMKYVLGILLSSKSCKKKNKILYHLYTQIIPHRIILHISAGTYISKYITKSLERHKPDKTGDFRDRSDGPKGEFSFIHNVFFFTVITYMCIMRLKYVGTFNMK